MDTAFKEGKEAGKVEGKEEGLKKGRIEGLNLGKKTMIVEIIQKGVSNNMSVETHPANRSN